MVFRSLAALACALVVVRYASGAADGNAVPKRVVLSEDQSPRVWIFCGTPGDEEHHAAYERMLTRLRNVLTKRFGVAPADLTVLYGPIEAGYDGECTRTGLLAELVNVVTGTKGAEARPVWLIFLGHSNAIAGGALYNLPGPDISPRELGEALQDADPQTPMVLFATTACSSAFLRPLSGPGRIVVTATSTSDAENETEFPGALVDALESPATDGNKDGFLTVTELFLACHERVLRTYEMEDLMVKEHSRLDGDGDGRGTQRPAAMDAEPASRIGLRIRTVASRKFD